MSRLRVVPERTHQERVALLMRIYGGSWPLELSENREAVRELAVFHARVERLVPGIYGDAWDRAREIIAASRSPAPP